MLEMAAPAGTLAKPSYADVDYVKELLEEIELREIPAPGPIEQRWTASSESVLSPAASEDPSEVFSWIGIIMYLPLADVGMRAKVTEAFRGYAATMRSVLPSGKTERTDLGVGTPATVVRRSTRTSSFRGRARVRRFVRRAWRPRT